MSSGRNDIRLIELKDTISQLNQTIRVQTEMIKDLRKTIEEHHASDEKKDQIISNLQAEISYLKAKLFGASSEKRRKEDLPGQMSLFDELMEEEPAKEIEPEYIEIKAHERKRKKKPDLNEQFRDIPVRQEFVDTLTEEQKTCSICGTKMVEIGHELIRSEVIFTPAKLEQPKENAIRPIRYDLNVYKYLNFLLEKRPNARTAQKELEKLAPWNEEVQKMFARKMK